GIRRIGLGAGVLGEEAQTIEEDRLAQLLLRREVAVERAHAHAGLLGDHVDGCLDALGSEDHLGRLEDAAPVPQRVSPQRTLRDRFVTAPRYLRLRAHGSHSLPGLTNGT